MCHFQPALRTQSSEPLEQRNIAKRLFSFNPHANFWQPPTGLIYEQTINLVVYDWVDGQTKRKPIAEANRLLTEADWPNGRDAKTGEPLILAFDIPSGGVGDKFRLDWMTR